MNVVDAAYEDNQAPAAPIDCYDDHLTVLMVAPGLDAIPEHLPGRGSSGRPTFQKLTKTLRNHYHAELVMGHAVATVREALAVAPSIDVVSIVIAAPDGLEDLEAVACNVFRRADLAALDFNSLSASEVFSQGGVDCLLNIGGRTDELRPLDLTDHPDVLRVLAIAQQHMRDDDSVPPDRVPQ